MHSEMGSQCSFSRRGVEWWWWGAKRTSLAAKFSIIWGGWMTELVVPIMTDNCSSQAVRGMTELGVPIMTDNCSCQAVRGMTELGVAIMTDNCSSQAVRGMRSNKSWLHLQWETCRLNFWAQNKQFDRFLWCAVLSQEWIQGYMETRQISSTQLLKQSKLLSVSLFSVRLLQFPLTGCPLVSRLQKVKNSAVKCVFKACKHSHVWPLH